MRAAPGRACAPRVIARIFLRRTMPNPRRRRQIRPEIVTGALTIRRGMRDVVADEGGGRQGWGADLLQSFPEEDGPPERSENRGRVLQTCRVSPGPSQRARRRPMQVVSLDINRSGYSPVLDQSR
jgi:hypothetical protein